MKKFGSFDKVQAITETERLPVGGYILKILDAEEVEFSNGGSGLKISFDVAEGEHKDFYKQNYKNQQDEDKKWKGNLMLYVPRDDGSEMDEWTARKFKTAIEAIEDSNTGYHWDWNESALKGKKVGGIFFNKEYDYNGRNGFYTACHSFKSVECIKSGKYKIPADKLLNKSDGTIRVGGAVFEEIDDEGLPF